MSKKPFKETTVGKLLFGAATVINPTLGSVLNGVTSPKEAIAEITKAKISTDDANSDSWLSKNVRPLVLVWCIVVFSFAGLLDSIDDVPFHIGELWNDTFEKVMMAVVLAYFGGRSGEKVTSIFKK